MSKKKNRQAGRHHFKLIALVFLLVAVAALYLWGSFYYQKDRQIERLVQGISNPQAKMTAYVVPATPDLTISQRKLRPLQEYFKHNGLATKQLAVNLHHDTDTGQIDLIEGGRYFLLFPKYVLRVQVFHPQAETNHASSKLYVDQKDYGRMAGAVSNFYRDLGLVLPGRYHLSVITRVSGRRLKADSVVNIWSNKTIDLQIRTGTFQVRSVPHGVIYLNDKRVKKLNRFGKAVFKNYPLTKKMELYIVTQYHGHKIRSAVVKDLSSSINPAFSQSDDSTSDYSNTTDYTGNATKDVYQDVEGDYVVNPIWPGLVSQKQAQAILRRNLRKAAAADFVSQQEYHALKKQVAAFRRGKKQLRVKVRVTNILPMGKGRSQVAYRVFYRYRHHGKKKKKTVHYEKAIFVDQQNAQLILRMGRKIG